MHAPAFVRRFQRLGNLVRNRPGLVQPQRAAPQTLGEILPVDQLHDERAAGEGRLQPVNPGDVGVIERCEHLCLALEPGQPIGIAREVIGQDLDRDLAVEPHVARAVDLAHAAGAERSEDLVRAEASVGGE